MTAEELRQIQGAEDAVRALGFEQVRVHHHGNMARIELGVDELPRALERKQAQSISRAVHDWGFRYVAVELEGR